MRPPGPHMVSDAVARYLNVLLRIQITKCINGMKKEDSFFHLREYMIPYTLRKNPH